MTCRELLKIMYPDSYMRLIDDECPTAFGLVPFGLFDCRDRDDAGKCEECWDQIVPDLNRFATRFPSIATVSTIKDSGKRREFESGAVRDICEGKGRCDLLPLDIVALFVGDSEIDKVNYASDIFDKIDMFRRSGDIDRLLDVLIISSDNYIFPDVWTMLIEVSKHFEDGCKKYGEHNWQKGIPVHCYIDSAIRHYLKYSRGDKDERHDRAFVWNIMCCVWTCVNKPEFKDFCNTGEGEGSNALCLDLCE